MFEKGVPSERAFDLEDGKVMLGGISLIGHTTTWLELRLSMSLNLWVLFRFQRCLDVAKPLDLGWERGHHEANLALCDTDLMFDLMSKLKILDVCVSFLIRCTIVLGHRSRGLAGYPPRGKTWTFMRHHNCTYSNSGSHAVLVQVSDPIDQYWTAS